MGLLWSEDSSTNHLAPWTLLQGYTNTSMYYKGPCCKRNTIFFSHWQQRPGPTCLFVQSGPGISCLLAKHTNYKIMLWTVKLLTICMDTQTGSNVVCLWEKYFFMICPKYSFQNLKQYFLTFNTLQANSADVKLMKFSVENRLWHFMQIVSLVDNLHEMSKPIFYGK